ncbi:MAG: UDP-N-acetylmuramoyl-tripeptide--D-alanyl-D-alanine ligase [Planctomycetota bacterium]|nr:UDP-N-acetylmuramoyl-tripeptide--D-alanyl-D-alanine ligase [Planctomycetota bacterium]
MPTTHFESPLLPSGLNLDDVADTLQASGDRNSSIQIAGISTDSRSIGKGYLFVAIKGDRFDGHDFIPAVARLDAAAAVVSTDVPDAADLPLIRVEDTLKALGKLGNFCRRRSNARVLAITGSNGKTTVKNFVSALLQKFGPVTSSPLSYNNNIGVPLTLFSSRQSDKWLVLEMGTNHFGELHDLAAIAEPEVAVITNIGETHLEFLGDQNGVVRAKGELIESLNSNETAVLNADDPFLPILAAKTSARILTFGISTKADICASDIEPSPRGLRFRVNGSFMTELAVPGRYNIHNALAAIGAGYACGLPLNEIIEAVPEFRLPKLRMQTERIGPVQVVLDAYNANPTSMSYALEEFARWPVNGRRLIILGEMGELGDASRHSHQRIGEQVARYDFDHLFSVGREAAHLHRSAIDAGVHACNATHFENTLEAAEAIRTRIRPGDTLFLKGSRSNGLERVADELRTLFGGNS